MASNVSLGLVKYSFTDSLKLPLTWKHDIRPGLALVFSSPYMKITLGGEVLNTIDLHRKVQEAEDAIVAMQSRNVVVRNEDLPISAMIRSGLPVLALLHSLPSGAVQRFQLRFHSESDFQVAHSLVKRAGVRIFAKIEASRPSTSDTIARPSSEQSTIIPPSNALSTSTVQSSTLAGSEYAFTPRLKRGFFAQKPLNDVTNASRSSGGLHSEGVLMKGHDEQDLRPSTAPKARYNGSLAAMLPPRRELPFAKPSSRGSDSIKKPPKSSYGNPSAADRAVSVSKRPSTADLPPLRPPTYATRSATAAERKSMAATEKKHQSTNLPSTQEHDAFSSQYFTAFEPSSSIHSSKPFTENMRLASSTLERPSSAIADKAESTHGRAQPSLDQDRQDDQRSHQLTNLIRDAAGSKDLQSYAMQTQDDRETLLNEFFVECIEDDGFQLLCQDVASSWRRVGLGLT